MLRKTYILINILAFVIFQEEKVWQGRNKVLQISDFYLGHCKKYFPQRLKKKNLNCVHNMFNNKSVQP